MYYWEKKKLNRIVQTIENCNLSDDANIQMQSY